MKFGGTPYPGVGNLSKTVDKGGGLPPEKIIISHFEKNPYFYGLETYCAGQKWHFLLW